MGGYDAHPAAGTGPSDGLGAEGEAFRTRIPAYRLETPVELWFGEDRIGVKAGSATCEEFLRFADALLSQYRAARGGSG